MEALRRWWWVASRNHGASAPGLCELLSFCFYKEGATEKEGLYHAQSIEKNPDVVYGGGFRLVHSQYLRMGLSSLFQFVKAHKRLPA
jgi:hypothetical protein